MRILFLTPTAFPEVSGNAITVERWRRGLLALRHQVHVLSTRHLSAADLQREYSCFQPEIVHAHHAYKSGRMALALGLSDIPLVVSPAGTDVAEDLSTPHRGQDVIGVLTAAHRIVVQQPVLGESIAAAAPSLRDRTVLVPKSVVWLGAEPYDLRAAAGWNSAHFVFFLPAGVRPVKDNLWCLKTMARVHALRPHVRVVFSGPPLDADYALEFSESLKEAAYARWLPTIAPDAMHSAYESVDVALNTSRAEGLSNALLEAEAAGVPSLASDIPPNRASLNSSGSGAQPGLLYSPGDADDFIRQAIRLVDRNELRAELRRAARDRAQLRPDFREEARGLAAVYEESLQQRLACG